MSARVAIIGTGWGVRIQVPKFRSAGLNITALCGHSESKVTTLAKDLGIPFATVNFEEILQRSDVDLVSIVMPPFLHKEMSIKALKAGKHVLCDKPTAINSSEAEEMLNAAREASSKNLLSVIDHELRTVPALMTMRRYSCGDKSDYVGELLHANLSYHNNSRLSAEREFNWWSNREQGGGTLGAISSHLIDLLQWLTDARASGLSAILKTCIQSRKDSSGTARPVTADDYATLHLKCEAPVPGVSRVRSPFAAVVTSSMVSAGPISISFIINGKNGSLHFDGYRLLGYKQNSQEPDILHDGDIKPDDNIFPLGTEAIGRVLLKRMETGNFDDGFKLATFEDGLYVQKVLDAARLSNDESQRWVEIQ